MLPFVGTSDIVYVIFQSMAIAIRNITLTFCCALYINSFLADCDKIPSLCSVCHNSVFHLINLNSHNNFV